MTIHQPIAAEGGWMAGTAGLRLVRATAASWTKEREAEAHERGYRVTYHKDAYGQTVATFWNGPILCFTREWTP